MFENHQREQVEALIESDKGFRRLYQRHQELDNQVNEAEKGALPIDDAALSVLKRKKLMTKDELQQRWDQQTGQPH